MDHFLSGDRHVEVDLESGGTTSEDERTREFVALNNETRRSFSKVWNDILVFDRTGKSECGLNSCSSSSSFGGVDGENMEFCVDKNSSGEENRELMALMEKNFSEEKCKKKNSRKPPRPPRPPKGPLLDAADQKLVREIAELAMRKRARMKRIQAMKKMKAAKASSSSSSLSAMVITVLFCLVILFQGMCSRHGANGMFEGSPAPTVGSSEGLISVQLYKSFPTEEKLDHDPSSLVERRDSGSVLGETIAKVAR